MSASHGLPVQAVVFAILSTRGDGVIPLIFQLLACLSLMAWSFAARSERAR